VSIPPFFHLLSFPCFWLLAKLTLSLGVHGAEKQKSLRKIRSIEEVA
jgi:hypothetical protein